jgi:exodeoxyribonuclease-3
MQGQRVSLVPFHKLGYPYVAVNGQTGYHGVAVASKLPLAQISKRAFCGNGDARRICVILAPNGTRSPLITLHNFYVPAGAMSRIPA